MLDKTTTIRLKRRIPYEEISWNRVSEALCDRFRLDAPVAGKFLKRFRSKLGDPLDISWFLSQRTLKEDAQIASSLCEIHGTDELTIFRSTTLGPFRVRKAAMFAPYLNGEERGACKVVPELSIEGFGRRLTIRSKGSAVSLLGITALISVVGYLFAALLLIYGLAVISVSIYSPGAITLEAFRNPTLLIGLFCSLTALVGLYRSWIIKRMRERSHSS